MKDVQEGNCCFPFVPSTFWFDSLSVSCTPNRLVSFLGVGSVVQARRGGHRGTRVEGGLAPSCWRRRGSHTVCLLPSVLQSWTDSVPAVVPCCAGRCADGSPPLCRKEGARGGGWERGKLAGVGSSRRYH